MSVMDVLVYVVPLIFFSPIPALYFQLMPLHRLAGEQRLPIQFTLWDLFALTGMLSASGFVLMSVPEREDRLVAITGIWFFTFAAWLYAVRLVSRAGVTRATPRLVLEFFAVPYSAYGVAIFWILMVDYQNMLSQYRPDWEQPLLECFWIRARVSQSTARFVLVLNLAASIAFIAGWLVVPWRIARWAAAASGNSVGPSIPPDAPLLDPHVKDIRLK